MRFTVYDDADSPVEDFAVYGEATAEARLRSAQAKNPDAVYSVRDHEYGLTLNRFHRGESLKERLHKNAVIAVIAARSPDQLQHIVAEYADELGAPDLGTIPYDEAVARCTDSPAMVEVFQAAAEKSDQFQNAGTTAGCCDEPSGDEA